MFIVLKPVSSSVCCDELITRAEESYRMRCDVVCDLQFSRIKRRGPTLGRNATGEKSTRFALFIQSYIATLIRRKVLIIR